MSASIRPGRVRTSEIDAWRDDGADVGPDAVSVTTEDRKAA